MFNKLGYHARLAVVFCCLLVSLSAFPPLVSAAGTAATDREKASSTLTNGALYYIQTTGNLYLDVQSGADANYAPVQQYVFNGNNSQKWRLIDQGGGYYSLQSACGSGTRVLDVYAGSNALGTHLDIYDFNGSNAQKFKIRDNKDGTFSLLTGTSGATECVDRPNWSSASGTQMQQWLCYDNDTAQKFVFQKASDVQQSRATASSVQSGKKYYIRSAASNLYLNAESGADSNGDAIGQEPYSQSATEQWIIADAGNGCYTIQSAGSFFKRAIDIPAGSGANMLTAQLYDANGTGAQKYKITRNSDGTFSFSTAASGFAKSLDIPSGSRSAGTKVWQYNTNGTTSQKFVLEQVADTLNTSPASSIQSGSQYYIQSSFSGLFASPFNGISFCDGVKIVQDSRYSGLGQRWQFNRNSDGTYTILNAEHGKALDVYAGSNGEGAAVQLYAPNGTDAQKWYVSRNSDGTFSLTAKCTGGKKGLDVNNLSALPGEMIHQWTYRAQQNEKWNLIPVSGGQDTTQSAAIQITSNTSATLKDPINVSGWAVNPANVKNVAIYLDSTLADGFLGNATIGQSSSSVPQQYSAYPGSSTAGFSFSGSSAKLAAFSAGSTHTLYVVAIGYDGSATTTSYQQTYQPDLTVTSPGNSTLTQSLSFGGKLLTGNVNKVSVYLNQLDSGHYLGDAAISGSAYSFSGNIDLTKANVGSNEIIVIGTRTDGSSTQAGFSMNMPGPVMNIDDPANNANVTDSTIRVDGWAMNYSGAKPQLNILIDGKTQKTITTNVSRPDVTSNDQYPAYKEYKSTNSSGNVGFDTTVNVSSLSSGSHTLTVQFTGDGGQITSQSKQFTIPQTTYQAYNISFASLLDYQWKSQVNFENQMRALSGSAAMTDAEKNDLKSRLSTAMNPSSYQYNPTTPFEFLNLKWVDGITVSDLNRMLTNCGVLTGKGDVFLAAGKAAGVNPVYLVAHARIETGNGTSKLAKGLDTSGSPYGYYNMYGIGAIDGNGTVSAGNATAKYYNWNSVDAAITGGASWIGHHYVNSIALNAGDGKTHYDQTTLYEMKWDPYGWSKGQGYEYATDFSSITNNWAYSIAGIIYNYHDIFNHTSPIKFIVPKYN